MRKYRRLGSQKITPQIDLDSSFEAKQILIDHSMNFAENTNGWLEESKQSIQPVHTIYRPRPKSNIQTNWVKKRSAESFCSHKLDLRSAYREKVDLKSIIFPLGS